MERLVKGKFQDNLEFCQWMKGEWDKTMGERVPEYDPVAVRETHMKRKSRRHTRKLSGNQDLSNLDHNPRNPQTENPSPRRAVTNSSNVPTGTTRLPSRKNESSERLRELEAKLENCQKKADLDAANIANLVKERDFYFDKLRNVEIKIQELEEPKPQIVLDIVEILYAVEEGFDVPDAV